MSEAKAAPVETESKPAVGPPKRVKEAVTNAQTGEVTIIEHSNEPALKYERSPYLAVDRESGLPLLPFPLQVVGELAKNLYECDHSDQALATSLKVAPDQVKAWREEGTDPKRLLAHIQTYLGMKLIPVPLGMLVEPTSEGRMRMVSAAVDPDDGGVVWVPDWNHGELLFRRIESKFFETDPRPAVWKKNYEANKAGGFRRGIADLKGTWDRKPVVLVGSSPSLAKNGHLLAELQDMRRQGKVLVVGCNRAFKYHPPEFFDYYFCADFEGRREWYQGYDCNKTECVTWLYSTRLIREFFRDDRIRWFISPLCKGTLPEEEGHRDLGWLMEGPSVSVDMLHFAFHWLQASPILMVGFDFSYPAGKDGMMERYPGEPMFWGLQPGMTFTQAQMWDGSDRLYVEPTSRMLLDQSRHINYSCMWIRRAGRRVINCTEGGIQRNPDRMPFREAIDRFVIRGEDAHADPVFTEIRRLEQLAMTAQAPLREEVAAA